MMSWAWQHMLLVPATEVGGSLDPRISRLVWETPSQKRICQTSREKVGHVIKSTGIKNRSLYYPVSQKRANYKKTLKEIRESKQYFKHIGVGT
jgi:hypothetical protein